MGTIFRGGGTRALGVCSECRKKENESGGSSVTKWEHRGDGMIRPRGKVLCLSQQTRYLVLQASEILADPTPGQINMAFSLKIKQVSSEGVTISPREAQDLLFGFDAKRFTRRTPAVFLVAPRNPTDAAFPQPSYLAADGKVDMVPYLKASELPAFREGEGSSIPNVPPRWTNISAPLSMSTGHFLETLARFVNHVLSPSGEPPWASQPRLQLDLGTMEALPHSQLNLSDEGALEQLVGSDDHLVVLFPGDNQAWVDQQAARWSLEGPLLQQLLQKLQAVIQDLEGMPSFRSNAEHLQSLLAFCYYPPGSPEKPSNPPGAPSAVQETSLLATIAVRARWRQSRRASSRAHRRARHQDDYCQLREFKVDLISMHHIILPESYNANNCVGPCRSPLSTRIHDYYQHTIFLLRMYEQGTPVTRPPCCIPVKYSKFHMITVTQDQGVVVKAFPNMVAESCGCR
ncbi:hypothetical protein JRQ81_008748 [Phrynocephalus forsythii]|uniref:Muellerian-inhibiting factor n=1 Tax=Phrynocephalus forsythii TaxID=171643 RepID=A0A9Q1ASL2_9SAUR|nr:hypothetical protein JRQ81_008748 [Phrynocephalus forsythii]